MDQWDEEKLRNVVLSKHGNPRTTTDVNILVSSRTVILILSLRSSANISLKPLRPKSELRLLHNDPLPDLGLLRFGWFWECPNGGEKCQYRHALPPGFMLKSQRKAAAEAEKANMISLEEFLEVEVCILDL